MRVRIYESRLCRKFSCGGSIAAHLNELDKTDELPKTIIFSLNPADNEQIGTLLGCFWSTYRVAGMRAPVPALGPSLRGPA